MLSELTSNTATAAVLIGLGNVLSRLLGLGREQVIAAVANLATNETGRDTTAQPFIPKCRAAHAEQVGCFGFRIGQA